MQAYDAVTTQGGRYVQGGGCLTVGLAGLVQSGGFGSYSKRYGLAAGSLLEAEVVTADGKIRIANACTNADLFWALKGGGGGTFGVVSRDDAAHARPARVLRHCQVLDQGRVGRGLSTFDRRVRALLPTESVQRSLGRAGARQAGQHRSRSRMSLPGTERRRRETSLAAVPRLGGGFAARLLDRRSGRDRQHPGAALVGRAMVESALARDRFSESERQSVDPHVRLGPGAAVPARVALRRSAGCQPQQRLVGGRWRAERRNSFGRTSRSGCRNRCSTNPRSGLWRMRCLRRRATGGVSLHFNKGLAGAPPRRNRRSNEYRNESSRTDRVRARDFRCGPGFCLSGNCGARTVGRTRRVARASALSDA